MVNTEEFIKRLEIILEYYNLNASAFADKIGVQRSSLSHLLSGRNKPSLDFILKILEEFPEVDLYWMLNGKGSFPKIEQSDEDSPAPSVNNTKPSTDLFTEQKTGATQEVKEIRSEENMTPILTSELIVEKIVVFYTNGTFKSYLSK
ncbi:helix-turn-helix domain-containing protein [Flavobacterium algicola]|uniref:helix-turn-helix domain-containing protein n=1 Tax=Flavobacterium algicola TaxID=556529 RepID=UPI001EFCE4B9|nr:helix-turn-helix transcriptional regulator [Flavobacterium algicola]MCG9792873.1 helix-turn-helix domain-containing protein [Flavobacterium algicola]